MNESRDELILIACDLLQSMNAHVQSFTAQVFVDRARANMRAGNYINAVKYVKLAKGYIAPEGMTA